MRRIVRNDTLLVPVPVQSWRTERPAINYYYRS